MSGDERHLRRARGPVSSKSRQLPARTARDISAALCSEMPSCARACDITHTTSWEHDSPPFHTLGSSVSGGKLYNPTRLPTCPSTRVSLTGATLPVTAHRPRLCWLPHTRTHPHTYIHIHVHAHGRTGRSRPVAASPGRSPGINCSLVPRLGFGSCVSHTR